MAHIHETQIVLNISKLASGQPGECCEEFKLPDELREHINAVVAELLEQEEFGGGMVVETILKGD